MTATFLAAVLRPFFLLAVLGALLFIRYAIIWWWPEGKVKRFLLTDLDRTKRRRHDTGRQGPAHKLLQQ
jgi:hypothetical protein